MRALWTAAEAWSASPRTSASSSGTKRRSHSVSHTTSTPRVEPPNRSGWERHVFSPQRSIDSRLCASSPGSERVSITGRPLNRISRSCGRSSSGMTSASTL